MRQIDARSKALDEVDTVYTVSVVCDERQEGVIRNVLVRHIQSEPSMTVQAISTLDVDEPGRANVIAEVFSSRRNERFLNDLVSRISIEPTVTAVRWDLRSS